MNVVIVEDSELISSQIRRVLGKEPRINIIGVASEESTAIALILSSKPDAVLLDLSLAPGSGIAVLRAIREAGICSHVFVLTNKTEDAIRLQCEGLGISGFFDKSAAAQECFNKLIALLPPMPPVRPLFAIVEDEPFMAELVSDMLGGADVDVEVFSLGTALLKSPNLQWFTAIILDLSLPDICGFDLMDKLAADAEGMSMVLMSGHDLAVLRAAKIYGNGIGLKVRGVLSKPFSRDQIFASLGLLLTAELGQAL